MSDIGSIGSLAATPVGSTTNPSRGSEFASKLDTFLATGRTRNDEHRDQRTTESGAISQAVGTTGSLAQNAASLFGNVFGALGAATGHRTTASHAVSAYGKAS